VSGDSLLTTDNSLVLVADKNKRLQFFLPNYFLHGIPFVQRFVLVDVKHFMGNAKAFNGFKVEQQFVQVLQLLFH
jgi:hypothetical protein